MRITRLAFASGLALSFSTAAFAADPQTAAAVQPAPATDDGSTLICHLVSHEGTVLPGRVCLTKAGWERARRLTQQTISEIQVRSFSRPVK